ncbi:universal stress protein [Vibrio hannami]|uniref:universal stress protein n=1 Tax=Vibrio hannami TaxID=2717094 RepID=UPI00240EBE17|nr:universal stress protein [Vibrio hannami]MDG3088476.1 universal stress protein [Vibrio hannami]
MTYKHILVAVDLSDESSILVDKAAGLASAVGAKLSLIHVDVVQDDDFTRQIVNSLVAENDDNPLMKKLHAQLTALKNNVSCDVENTLISCGGLSEELERVVEAYDIDLIVSGHHQDFWHTVNSSAKRMLKSIPVDMLVIPLS